MLIGSAEYQRNVWRRLYAVFFFDAGNAQERFTWRVNKGLGLGLMYGTPVGPISVTWTKAMSKRTHPSRIELTMGPELL